MMQIEILTLFPESISGYFEHSIMKRAAEKGLASVRLHQLRDFTPLKHRQVDDYMYGGGAGMVLMCEPLALALDHLQEKEKADEIIFLTPDGQPLNQSLCNGFSLGKKLILVCGHYKGIDQRIRDLYITREISIGDYVLSGGELAAAVLTDAVIRLLPGVLSDETSALTDSFQDGLLAPPVYTRPAEFRGLEVPPVLLSGHEAQIEAWRFEQQMAKTKERRPDLLSDQE
jgi:tRNA (guanine37-N1)-methyltransferase